jgi:hypothetical protein
MHSAFPKKSQQTARLCAPHRRPVNPFSLPSSHRRPSCLHRFFRQQRWNYRVHSSPPHRLTHYSNPPPVTHHIGSHWTAWTTCPLPRSGPRTVYIRNSCRPAGCALTGRCVHLPATIEGGPATHTRVLQSLTDSISPGCLVPRCRRPESAQVGSAHPVASAGAPRTGSVPCALYAFQDPFGLQRVETVGQPVGPLPARALDGSQRPRASPTLTLEPSFLCLGWWQSGCTLR